jgi:hypothetical protein
MEYPQAIASLEAALLEYVEHYGITKKASEAFRQSGVCKLRAGQHTLSQNDTAGVSCIADIGG